MKNIPFYLLLSLITFTACTTSTKIMEETIWVNSYKTDCVGVGPMKCLLVQKGGEIEEDKWTNFYDQIEGFDYIPGYVYQLKIAVEDLDTVTLPADASSKKYKLLKILSKNADLKLKLTDIWVLTQIRKEDISLKNEKERPRLEIKVSDKKIMGKAVCNRFNGQIDKVSETVLEIGNNIASTRMMCLNMDLESEFLTLLPETKTYAISKNQLILKNAEGAEILRFQKTD